MTRKEVAQALDWPLTKIELIETGRTKVDRELVTTPLHAYGIQLDQAAHLLTQVVEAAEPEPSDTLAWITSHAFRKSTATVLDNDGQTARQIAERS